LKTFTLLCCKFIKEAVYQLSPESGKVYRRYNKNILAYFLIGHGVVFSQYNNYMNSLNDVQRHVHNMRHW